MQQMIQSLGAVGKLRRPRRGAVLAVAAASLLVLLALLIWRRAAPAPEVLRAELRPQAGRLYRAGREQVAFTGWMIERYESGLLKSRSGIVEGLLQGVSEGWHTNGQMQVREHFQAGVSHGLRIKWHDNGVKQSEGTVVNGKLQGTFRRWHENGKLAEEMELNGDTPEGLARSFYPSGFLKAEARLKEGQVTEQKFWKDGERNAASAAAAAN